MRPVQDPEHSDSYKKALSPHAAGREITNGDTVGLRPLTSPASPGGLLGKKGEVDMSQPERLQDLVKPPEVTAPKSKGPSTDEVKRVMADYKKMHDKSVNAMHSTLQKIDDILTGRNAAGAAATSERAARFAATFATRSIKTLEGASAHANALRDLMQETVVQDLAPLIEDAELRTEWLARTTETLATWHRGQLEQDISAHVLWSLHDPECSKLRQERYATAIGGGALTL